MLPAKYYNVAKKEIMPKPFFYFIPNPLHFILKPF